MRNKIIAQISVFVAFVFIFAFPAFAEENQISKILISPTQNNTYSINVYFNNEYDNKAFIEQNASGHYSIYLQDASLKNNRAKVLYSNTYDKNNIKLFIEQKPMITKDKASSYVVINTIMNADYSLRVSSKTLDEDKLLLFSASAKNTYPLFLIGVLLLIIFLFRQIKTINKSRNIYNSHTSFPSTYQPRNYERKKKTIVEIEKSPLKQYKKNNTSTNPFKVADRDSFSCFDIPFVEEKDKSYSFNNIIQKSNQTNAINDERDMPSLDIPYAEESMKEKQKEKKVVKPKDEKGHTILSLLNIDGLKGFYISEAEDGMELYAFIKENKYLLKKFKDLSQLNLQARFYDNSPEGEVFIVRLDTYKSMVEFANNSIRELVVL